MIIPRKEDLAGLIGVPRGSMNDTKKAVVFATLGLPLDPVIGILVMRSPGRDRLDGEAHYTFNVPIENWNRVCQLYAAGDADSVLDEMLDRLKADPTYTVIGAKLEQLVSDALVVYGRRFLENYQRMVALLMNKGRDIEIREKKAGAFEFKFQLARRQ